VKNNFSSAKFPPDNDWDGRLDRVACISLAPVVTMHENAWFTVKNRGGYYTVEDLIKHVVVLPVIEEQFVLMIRVKRPVLNDCPLEFPAGGFEEGETPLEAAARELYEETGIRVTQLGRFIPMTPLSISPNRIPRLAYVFRINLKEVEFSNRVKHDHEVESIHKIHVSEVPKIMSDGSVYVAVPLALLGMYLVSNLKGGGLLSS